MENLLNIKDEHKRIRLELAKQINLPSNSFVKVYSVFIKFDEINKNKPNIENADFNSFILCDYYQNNKYIQINENFLNAIADSCLSTSKFNSNNIILKQLIAKNNITIEICNNEIQKLNNKIKYYELERDNFNNEKENIYNINVRNINKLKEHEKNLRNKITTERDLARKELEIKNKEIEAIKLDYIKRIEFLSNELAIKEKEAKHFKELYIKTKTG